MMKIIDLRSDTVTRPSEPMRQAMATAEVGDDVYRDDPTVITLEETCAERLGFESTIFTSSGTQANLIALMSHCGRGDEYIVGQLAHTYKYEAGGAAVLGSIQPQPIEFEADSTLDLQKVAAKIKPDDIHFARTRLLCLENTQNGRILPADYLQEAASFARDKNLVLHLDGARLFNAAVGQNVAAGDITKHFDSTAVCLSKGLGCPVGSLLCGTQSFIEEARKWRKMVGGGMRQAGILAAAGLYALEHNIDRLATDHENASHLAEGLGKIDAIEIEGGKAHTNMLFFEMDEATASELALFLQKSNILMSPGKTIRLVTHIDITEDDVELIIEKINSFFSARK